MWEAGLQRVVQVSKGSFYAVYLLASDRGGVYDLCKDTTSMVSIDVYSMYSDVYSVFKNCVVHVQRGVLRGCNCVQCVSNYL